MRQWTFLAAAVLAGCDETGGATDQPGAACASPLTEAHPLSSAMTSNAVDEGNGLAGIESTHFGEWDSSAIWEVQDCRTGNVARFATMTTHGQGLPEVPLFQQMLEFRNSVAARGGFGSWQGVNSLPLTEGVTRYVEPTPQPAGCGCQTFYPDLASGTAP